MANDKRITVEMLKYFKTKQDGTNDAKFVAKDSNKALISSADQTKLDGIESGAQVNVIESINIDGTNQTISNKAVTLDLSAYAKLTDIATVYRYKGNVEAYSNLPTYEESSNNNPKVGDVYNIVNAGDGYNAGDNVVCASIDTTTGDITWDNLAGIVDLSSYVTSTNLASTLTGYLTTAEFSKTLNGDVNDATNYPGLVTKETGKGLSTNDFNNDYKAILDRGDATKTDILMEIFSYTAEEAAAELA